MPYYRSVGEVPRKRHTQFRQPDGSLYAEELMGQEGFSSDSSLLYHRYAPTAIVAAEEFTPPAVTRVPNLPLKPRHLRTHKLDGGPADPVLGRRYLLANDDVRIAYVLADRPSPLFRDATGDHCLYVESGSLQVESTFGVLDAVAGDYVVIPTSTIHRLVPTGDEPARLLAIEAAGHVGPPKRYLSVRGQFLEHSPYCERDVRGPDAPLLVDGEEVEVLVRHRRGWTRYVYAHHPFDVVGWDGHLYPWAFSIHDFEPITGRIHQPPPVHQTFQGPNFVICSFVPRKVDYHPDAIPVPYNHHNVDSDEMLFYTGGNYEARRGSGIEQGSISLHPSGFTHGPQPGAAERSIGADYFDELAVMVDTFRPLDLCDAAAECEDPGYAWTWARRP
ncbi:homogentisate 1,2-dioxygenase [Micromonospora echinospora]|uniref:Homogentisate 1,2-dioxygenase n=1 Tax=Micromonospora echinospora TaxID=1877 RepID=A0A1C4WUC0_MICEC|nr:cupin domain-containing protein [Micromonospora echinospora]OZV79733.1 homogentisate 1,2-dioxygenase [Micromonospora echinospora]SCE99802.1 homogentisate 1,2-dioxygenase [Micromonospora echinospora]